MRYPLDAVDGFKCARVALDRHRIAHVRHVERPALAAALPTDLEQAAVVAVVVLHLAHPAPRSRSFSASTSARRARRRSRPSVSLIQASTILSCAKIWPSG